MAFQAILGAVGAVAGIAGSLTSNRQRRKAARYERKAVAIERNMDRIQNIRTRRQAQEDLQVQQAEQIAQATTTGGGTSSALSAATSSLASQTSSNIGFQTRLEGMNNQRLSLLDKAGKAGTRADRFQSIGSTLSNITGGSGSPFGDLGRIIGYGG